MFATAFYDEAGLYFAKEHTNLKLGDTRFTPDNDDMYFVISNIAGVSNLLIYGPPSRQYRQGPFDLKTHAE